MSKLGYFLGGAVAGVLGTIAAAYLADASATSGGQACLHAATEEDDSPSDAEAAGEQAARMTEEPDPATTCTA